MLQCKNYIAGQWVSSRSGQTFPSIDPASGLIMAVAPRSDADDVADAVAAARAAFDGGDWSTAPGAVRAGVLHRFAQLLRENADRLADVLTRETGKPLRNARGEILYSADVADYFAGLARTVAGQCTQLSKQTLSLVLWEPVGVCGLIVPWNFPVSIALWKIAPVLAAGCTIVLKPSEHTPAVSLEILKLLDAIAELPKGVVNGIAGFGDAGAALVGRAGVDKIAFTGSTLTGRKIMASASERLTRISLECGGKSPNIVFADAPMPKALDGALSGIFRNAGQVCTAGSRLLVQDAIYDEFMAAFLDRARQIKVGSGFDPEVQMGPLISKAQMERVLGYIAAGKAEGARLLHGGNRLTAGELAKGFFVAPTVFADVQPAMTIAREEIFGPVVSVLRFRDEDEAVRIANDAEYGLAAGVWTQDLSRAARVAGGIKAGTVWLNTFHKIPPESPFGGHKQSGLGRELGPEGLREFLESKHVCLDLGDKFEVSR